MAPAPPELCLLNCRPVPAATRQAAAAPRPPKAPLTQPQPFSLSTDARAPRRAAALAAEQAVRDAVAGTRVRVALIPAFDAAAAAASNIFSQTMIMGILQHVLRLPGIVDFGMLRSIDAQLLV